MRRNATPPIPSAPNKKRRAAQAASLVVVVGCCMALLGACADKKKVAAPVSTEPPTSSTTIAPTGPPPSLKLTEVAKLNQPIAITQRTGSDDLFVAERSGKVLRINSETLVANAPVLEMSDQTTADGERGLLGIAFKPNSNLLYVDFTDKSGATKIDEYKVDDSNVADTKSRRNVMTIAQPFPNHNGGQITFGPDKKYLYIGLGDGGGAGDPQNNGQNLSVPYGKILRIDPTQDGPRGYTIPYDNPFMKRGGSMGEVWSYGLRNPWRFSFDKQSGALWIGDVGEKTQEEIDRVDKDPTGGKNFGWSLREGTLAFKGEKPTDAIDPVFVYGRDKGCSVTGGYVYRGTAIAQMSARYVFGDYCSGRMWSLTLREKKWQPDELNIKVPNLISFGQDATGELYAMSQDGPLYRIDQG